MRLIIGIHLMTRNEIVAKLNKLRRKIKNEVRSFEAKAERV
jgi:hypothetical protein